MERRNACEAQANGMRAQEKEVTGRREQAGRELARLEEKKNALQSDYDAIIGRLWDEYEWNSLGRYRISMERSAA